MYTMTSSSSPLSFMFLTIMFLSLILLLLIANHHSSSFDERMNKSSSDIKVTEENQYYNDVFNNNNNDKKIRGGIHNTSTGRTINNNTETTQEDTMRIITASTEQQPVLMEQQQQQRNLQRSKNMITGKITTPSPAPTTKQQQGSASFQRIKNMITGKITTQGSLLSSLVPSISPTAAKGDSSITDFPTVTYESQGSGVPESSGGFEDSEGSAITEFPTVTYEGQGSGVPESSGFEDSEGSASTEFPTVNFEGQGYHTNTPTFIIGSVDDDADSMKPPLTDVSNDNNSSSGLATLTLLGLCEGDCDTDNDCVDDLICYLRDEFDNVPGCSGSGSINVDYCIIDPTITTLTNNSTSGSNNNASSLSFVPSISPSTIVANSTTNNNTSLQGSLSLVPSISPTSIITVPVVLANGTNSSININDSSLIHVIVNSFSVRGTIVIMNSTSITDVADELRKSLQIYTGQEMKFINRNNDCSIIVVHYKLITNSSDDNNENANNTNATTTNNSTSDFRRELMDVQSVSYQFSGRVLFNHDPVTTSIVNAEQNRVLSNKPAVNDAIRTNPNLKDFNFFDVKFNGNNTSPTTIIYPPPSSRGTNNAPNSVPITSADDNSSSILNVHNTTGIISGVIVGGVFFMVITGLFVLRQKRNKNNNTRGRSSNSSIDSNDNEIGRELDNNYNEPSRKGSGSARKSIKPIDIVTDFDIEDTISPLFNPYGTSQDDIELGSSLSDDVSDTIQSNYLQQKYGLGSVSSKIKSLYSKPINDDDSTDSEEDEVSAVDTTTSSDDNESRYKNIHIFAPDDLDSSATDDDEDNNDIHNDSCLTLLMSNQKQPKQLSSDEWDEAPRPGTTSVIPTSNTREILMATAELKTKASSPLAALSKNDVVLKNENVTSNKAVMTPNVTTTSEGKVTMMMNTNKLHSTGNNKNQPSSYHQGLLKLTPSDMMGASDDDNNIHDRQYMLQKYAETHKKIEKVSAPNNVIRSSNNHVVERSNSIDNEYTSDNESQFIYEDNVGNTSSNNQSNEVNNNNDTIDTLPSPSPIKKLMSPRKLSQNSGGLSELISSVDVSTIEGKPTNDYYSVLGRTLLYGGTSSSHEAEEESDFVDETVDRIVVNTAVVETTAAMAPLKKKTNNEDGQYNPSMDITDGNMNQLSDLHYNDRQFNDAIAAMDLTDDSMIRLSDLHSQRKKLIQRYEMNDEDDEFELEPPYISPRNLINLQLLSSPQSLVTSLSDDPTERLQLNESSILMNEKTYSFHGADDPLRAAAFSPYLQVKNTISSSTNRVYAVGPNQKDRKYERQPSDEIDKNYESTGETYPSDEIDYKNDQDIDGFVTEIYNLIREDDTDVYATGIDAEKKVIDTESKNEKINTQEVVDNVIVSERGRTRSTGSTIRTLSASIGATSTNLLQRIALRRRERSLSAGPSHRPENSSDIDATPPIVSPSRSKRDDTERNNANTPIVMPSKNKNNHHTLSSLLFHKANNNMPPRQPTSRTNTGTTSTASLFFLNRNKMKNEQQQDMIDNNNRHRRVSSSDDDDDSGIYGPTMTHNVVGLAEKDIDSNIVSMDLVQTHDGTTSLKRVDIV